MLNFQFLEKGLGVVSPSHVVYDFSGKMFLIYTQLPDQMSLPDHLYFLIYWSLCVLKLFGNQVVMS